MYTCLRNYSCLTNKMQTPGQDKGEVGKAKVGGLGGQSRSWEGDRQEEKRKEEATMN